MDDVKIVQVLLLFDDDFSRELGPALWAALIETEQFYNTTARKRATFERYYMSGFVPSLGAVNTTLRGIRRAVFGDDQMRSSLEMLDRQQRMSAASVTSPELTGKYARTYDQAKLADAVRPLVNAADAFLEIVTDRELTPPPEWRYLIWEDVKNGAVISTAPIDPNYWRERQTDRVHTIKKRARAALLGATGEPLGLNDCDNIECYMLDNVDSVLALDFMTCLGPEHQSDAPDLPGQTFLPTTDPALVQRVVPSQSPKP